jgi:nucleotide exchange factor SIL1
VFFVLQVTSVYLQNEVVFVKDEVDESQDTDDSGAFKIISEEFVATNEWQSIKPDQAIPKGLHVRINIQTGAREAKLLDQSENDKNKIPSPPIKISKQFESSILELNDQKREDLDKLAEETSQQQDVKARFRSYEELKEEMASAGMLIKTDNELMQELVSRYVKTTDQKIGILTDLEYYVHQYDNGILFCDMSGFELLLSELNETLDFGLKARISLVLGAALQGNPKVQVHALKFDTIQIMLNQLQSKYSTKGGNSKLQVEYYPKVMFVLSGLLRNFPFAQNLFVNKYGGVEVLENLLLTANSIKLKAKVFTLVNDLIQEKVYPFI